MHRVVWEELVGPIPEGMTVDHIRCWTSLCCDVNHLELVTAAENTRRMADQPDVCRNGHPRTMENTYRAPGTGWRQCRVCMNTRYKAR